MSKYKFNREALTVERLLATFIALTFEYGYSIEELCAILQMEYSEHFMDILVGYSNSGYHVIVEFKE